MILVGLVPQLIVNSVNPTVMNLLAHWRFLMLAWTIYLSFAGALVLALLPER